jgi:hypothetical protein
MGGSGGSPESPGVFLRTSIQSIWGVLRAFLPSSIAWLRGPLYHRPSRVVALSKAPVNYTQWTFQRVAAGAANRGGGSAPWPGDSIGFPPTPTAC